MRRTTEKPHWPQIPGVDQHLARTGEVAPHAWAGTPADMQNHGGYAVVSDQGVFGPFCWWENAEQEAGRHRGGRVVRWRTVSAAAVFQAKVEATLPVCLELRDRVCGRVAGAFGVASLALLGRRRTVRIALARQVAMALLYELHDFSTTEVGAAFGRDHGTVVHAVKNITHLREHGPRAQREKLRDLFANVSGSKLSPPVAELSA